MTTDNKRYIAPSELMINDDGSVYHLHIKPEWLADNVILVGDPGRVPKVSKYFDTIEVYVRSREFHAVTGTYNDKRIMVLSTGIGCDSIDIVMNELDALANIDFKTRTVKDQIRHLQIVRIGTCGGLQPFTPIGTYVCSVRSIGMDCLLNFYSGREKVTDTRFEKAFVEYMGWHDKMCAPNLYVAEADKELVDRIARDDMVRGVTISANGFFGPQGRELRIPLADPDQNHKIENFEFEGCKITNFEMESSAIAGLSRLMGHHATTVCMVIANRLAKEANTNYKSSIEDLILTVLDRL